MGRNHRPPGRRPRQTRARGTLLPLLLVQRPAVLNNTFRRLNFVALVVGFVLSQVVVAVAAAPEPSVTWLLHGGTAAVSFAR